jgi:hypothetical protein
VTDRLAKQFKKQEIKMMKEKDKTTVHLQRGYLQKEE